MVWSDFEILRSFTAENSKKRINFNTRCVTSVTFLEVDCNCDTFKQAPENNPDEFRSTRGSKNVVLKICKVL